MRSVLQRFLRSHLKMSNMAITLLRDCKIDQSDGSVDKILMAAILLVPPLFTGLCYSHIFQTGSIILKVESHFIQFHLRNKNNKISMTNNKLLGTRRPGAWRPSLPSPGGRVFALMRIVSVMIAALVSLMRCQWHPPRQTLWSGGQTPAHHHHGCPRVSLDRAWVYDKKTQIEIIMVETKPRSPAEASLGVTRAHFCLVLASWWLPCRRSRLVRDIVEFMETLESATLRGMQSQCL